MINDLTILPSVACTKISCSVNVMNVVKWDCLLTSKAIDSFVRYCLLLAKRCTCILLIVCLYFKKSLGAFKLKSDAEPSVIRAGSLFEKSKSVAETTVPVTG